MASSLFSGVLGSGATYNVATFSAYTVYAASGSTVTTNVGGTNVATYTIPASGVLTINDLADTVSVNATFRVKGLVATSNVM